MSSSKLFRRSPNRAAGLFAAIGATAIAASLGESAFAQCPPSNHDCCTTGTPGCTDLACCNQVCAVDPFCCATAWDSICVSETTSVCGIQCANCPPSNHNCFTTGGPGCTDTACCDLICAADSFCCTTAWDGICAGAASANCNGCGDPAGNDCCAASPNGTPFCNNRACCDAICAGDSFCCTTQWDGICANAAQNNAACDCGGGPACPPSDHNCFTTGNPGCTDTACCELICGQDPFCCDVAWDGICAGAAAQQCDGCGDPNGNDCCTGSADGTAYCNNRACCEAVCAIDPFCCDVGWDGICADEAASFPQCDCGPSCPDSDHNCFTSGGPGCTDSACCDTVCAIDPFCCDVEWDGICVNEAIDLCDGCGDPNAGDCCTEQKGPYCENRACCDLVCSIDPFCCEVAWDGICVDEAGFFAECDCGAKGTLSLEGASCQGDVDPDRDGVQIAIELWMRNLTGSPASGFQAFILFDDVNLNYNGAQSAYTASPFPLHIIPTAGAQDDFGELQLDGSSPFPSNCCFSHPGPGCDNAGCAAAVCAVDPFCCATAWDSICAGEAATLCGICAPPPTGDTLLAILIFDVKDECAKVAFDFGGSNFDSELSFEGLPIPTNLSPTGSILLDATPPTIDCPPGIKVSADVEIGGPPQSICQISNCCQSHPGTGCTNAACQDIVCTMDPFCCATAWDSICANEAIQFCPDTPGGTVVDPCVGAVVDYKCIADDNCELIFFDCQPPSGSFFFIGQTVVTCTAIDLCGNTTQTNFIVDVNATNLVKVDIVLIGSVSAERCIHFVADSCDVTADQVVSFTGFLGDGYGTAVLELPCDFYSQLCGKDEQHTKWDTVLLEPDGACWSATSALVLYPGDDDNDGDVDINDVTWLVLTFGDLAADGGCPWDGTRDADFNNGGAVQSEDYSLLSSQFLTKSECLCDKFSTEIPMLDPRTSIPTSSLPAALRAADLDQDGVFDWRDVAEFEIKNGLGADLSRRMRDQK